MRLSTLFGQTQRQETRYPPNDGRHWLLRAAYWGETATGRVWLPLGMAVQERLAAHLETALADAAAFPAPLQAAAFPQWEANAAQSLPAALNDFLAGQIASYRNLPRLLMNRREAYWEILVLAESSSQAFTLAKQVQSQWESALQNLGLPLRQGEGAPIASTAASIAFAPAPGEQATLRCPQCHYEAPQAWARRAKPAPPEEPPAPLTPVSTPHAGTIRALAEFLGVAESRTAKAVFLRTQESASRLVFAVVRGDMQVSLPKLARLLGVQHLKPADEDAIRAVGAVPGYASPVGVQGAVVVVDDLIPQSRNLIAGANREGYHFTGVNYGRDFQAEVVADIVAAAAGDPCPRCGAPLEAAAALPVLVSQPLETAATYLTAQGKPAPLGIAVCRMDMEAAIAALATEHHLEDGLAWPPSIAPYQVHLVALRGGEDEAEALYTALRQEGLSVLYDDRKASPGIKFTDADLIGLPVRVTVGKRSLQKGGAELKWRTSGEETILPLEAVPKAITAR